jgi:hypothetical protein
LRCKWNELKISTDLVRLHVRSEDSLDISMGGAVAAMRELGYIASHAKERLREQARPIVEADVEAAALQYSSRSAAPHPLSAAWLLIAGPGSLI